MDDDFLKELEWLDNYDICWECRRLHDDYYFDGDGEPVYACITCPYNPLQVNADVEYR